tara:strand:- start:273 stop:851 length:579 start_codon:yes stop_codon:yes gene_type:complete
MTDKKSTDKLDKNKQIEFTYNRLIGFIVLYVFLIGLLFPFLFYNIPFWAFTIYVCNIDQIALALSVSFPHYFDYLYNDESDDLWTDISFHIIKLIALTGIFMYGLQMKLVGRKDIIVLEGMITIAIITYTMPEYLMPRLTNILTKNIPSNKYSTIMVSSIIIVLFIVLESIFLNYYINTRSIDSRGKQLFHK